MTSTPHPPMYRADACELCQCEHCRARRAALQPDPPQPPPAAKRPRLGARVALVVLGAVAAPLLSLAVNSGTHVVDLGTFGTLAVLLTVLSALAHLRWAPRRVDEATLRLVNTAPESTTARLALLASAGFSCALCGYVALVFLPLLPLAIVLIVYLGLGLAGVGPYTALAVHIQQLVRAYVAVRERLGRGRAVAALLVALVALPVGVGAVGLYRHASARALDGKIAAIARAPELSVDRARAIAALAGRQDDLVARYLRGGGDQRAIAEAYHRLTDTTIDAAVRQRAPSMRAGAMLRPFAFLDGHGHFYRNSFLRF